MEKGEVVDVIYLDFAKAFDKVDHGILLRKLKELGIGGFLLKWLQEFLLNRQQRVAIDGVESQPCHVTSGVPQGTVLGPLMFLLHIGDIDTNLQSATTSTFADDTKVMQAVKTIDDADNLQDELNSVYDWASANNMQLNGNKFQHLRYGKSTSLDLGGYKTPDGAPISQVDQVMDLGVLMEESAKFDAQVRAAAMLGNRYAGWVLRVFATRQQGPMLILFKSLVLSRLEYCSALWAPQKLGLIRELENVQRAFTKKIIGMQDHCYEDRLRLLNLFSLERRRDRYRVIYVWRIINGLSPNLDHIQ